MFKKQIENLEFEVKALRKSKNGMSQEDAAKVDEAIGTLMDRIQALKDDEKAYDAETIAKINEDIAALGEKIKAISEKVAAEPEQAPAENYLNSKNSVHDYADALRMSKTNGEFRRNWAAKLSENGITITGGDEFGYTPAYVKGRIQDKWEHQFPWLNMLNNTGAKRYAVRYQSAAQSSTNPDVQAKGHTSPNKKVENAVTVLAESVIPQMVYDLIKVDKMIEFNDDEGLINYVIDCLSVQWNYKVAQCILVGDGLADSNHISSIDPIARASSDDFATVGTYNSSNEMIDEIMNKAVAPINTGDGDNIILFMSKADLLSMRRVVFGTGSTPQYVAKSVIAEQLGVSDIFTTDLLGSSKTYRFIAFRPDKYATVGSKEPRLDTWEDYDYNTTGYRLEAPFGGHLEGGKFAAVVKA